MWIVFDNLDDLRLITFKTCISQRVHSGDDELKKYSCLGYGMFKEIELRLYIAQLSKWATADWIFRWKNHEAFSAR